MDAATYQYPYDAMMLVCDEQHINDSGAAIYIDHSDGYNHD